MWCFLRGTDWILKSFLTDFGFKGSRYAVTFKITGVSKHSYFVRWNCTVSLRRSGTRSYEMSAQLLPFTPVNGWGIYSPRSDCSVSKTRQYQISCMLSSLLQLLHPTHVYRHVHTLSIASRRIFPTFCCARIKKSQGSYLRTLMQDAKCTACVHRSSVQISKVTFQ
jgi:hypothetical protein